jgi:alkylhydroperoxidase family enzyme
MSTTALVTSGVCWASCIASHFHWIEAEQLNWSLLNGPARCVALNRGAFLAGSFFILMSMLWHARHVILDAEGLLPRQRYARRGYGRNVAASIAEQQAAMAGMTAVTALPPHGSSRSAVVTPVMAQSVMTQPVLTPVVTGGAAGRRNAVASAMALEDAAGQVEVPVERTLTKQEKKALRQRLEKAREDRERRAG